MKQFPLRRKMKWLSGWSIMMLWVVASWLTHVVVTIQNEQWGMLIGGAIAVPIGCLHGTGHWVGIFS